MDKKNIKELHQVELEQLYEMVNKEISKLVKIVFEKTGYFTQVYFLLMGDEKKKCLDIDIKINLLEYPHGLDENKVQYYMKMNPDNVLNKPILAHEHNSWIMIYDGVHRVEANKRLGKKTVKVKMIVPSDFNKDKK